MLLANLDVERSLSSPLLWPSLLCCYVAVVGRSQSKCLVTLAPSSAVGLDRAGPEAEKHERAASTQAWEPDQEEQHATCFRTNIETVDRES